MCLYVTRFMATNDLMHELQKDSIKLDEDSERKVVNMLLKLLEDKNGEVQNLAVKWYMHAHMHTHMHTASEVQSLFGKSVCLSLGVLLSGWAALP